MSESDERVTNIILQRLESIERKLDAMQSNGCSKADGHVRMQSDLGNLFGRVGEIERAQAEGRGKLAIVVAVLSAASGLFFAWIGKHLT